MFIQIKKLQFLGGTRGMKEKEGPMIKRDLADVSTTKNAYPLVMPRKKIYSEILVTKMYKLKIDHISPKCPMEGNLYICTMI